VVGGTVSLQGNVSIQMQTGKPIYSGTYTIIESGSIVNQFYRTEFPGFVSLLGSITYNESAPGNVDVVFEQLKFSDLNGLSEPALAAARGLDKSVERVEADLARDEERVVVGTLNSSKGMRAMDRALTQITAVADRYWFPTAIASTSDIEKRLEERVPQQLDGVGDRLAVFAGVSFMDSDVSSEGGAESVGVNTSRFTGGVDFRMNSSLVLSGFYSNEVSKADTDSSGGKGKIKSHSFGVHADYLAGAWRFQGTVLIGADDYESNRSLHLAGLGVRTDSKTSGDRAGAAVSVSRSFGDILGGTLWPYAGLQYVFWDVDAYDEKGATLPLGVDRQKAESLIAKAGVRYDWHFRLKTVGVGGRSYLNLGWQSELGDTEREMSGKFNGSPWSLTLKSKRNGFVLRAGMEIDLLENLTISVSGGRENGLHDYDNMSLWGGLAWRF
jgi:uncharacterized protein YhjY with autotransporter beta-barrel domain